MTVIGRGMRGISPGSYLALTAHPITQTASAENNRRTNNGIADMIREQIDDWTDLTGHVICIRRKGRLIRVGQVETVGPDGDVLWLRNEGVEPRALYQKVEGYTAWTVPDAATQHVRGFPIMKSAAS